MHLFSLKSLPDAERNAGLVQRLVGVEGHPELVPHPEQQETPLHAVDGALSDHLVEALGVQFTANLVDIGN